MKLFSIRKLISVVACLLLIAAAIVSLGGCGKTTQETTTVPDSVDTSVNEETTAGEINVVGEGQTVFTFEVKDKDGNPTLFEVHTDEKTVGDALVNLRLIKGDEGAYGLYVKEVNGIVADYEVDGTYWALYVNGEMAATGVDEIEAENGATYTFAVE